MPEKGLTSLLEQSNRIFQEVPGEDPHSRVDIDTMSDYRRHCGDERTLFPSEAECLQLLRRARVHRNIVLHSTEVARIAVSISEHLNSRGWNINLGIVRAAGLLHDIAKGMPNHAQRGREIVSELGYQAVATIIASHMDIPAHMIAPISETGIVYLSDKMATGSSTVSLEDRFCRALTMYGEDAAIRKNIMTRLEHARSIKRLIETALDVRLEDIFWPDTLRGLSHARKNDLPGGEGPIGLFG